MPEQNWSNQTPDQLAKLSDQRLNEVLKRARIVASKASNGFNEIGNVDEDEFNRTTAYFELVKSEADKRPHFEHKGQS